MKHSVAVRLTHLVLASSGFFALLVAIVAGAYRYNVRVDLSPGSRFTLSDHALAVLRDLKVPVHVTGFIRTEDARNVILKDLLWQAARESKRVTYDVVDINRNPAMAAEYGVSAYGAAVVESRGQRSDFVNPTEGQLVGAILTVTQAPKKVYMLGGHGECSIKETHRHVGCSAMAISIRSEHYDIEEITLFGARVVPADADVLVIAGPTADPLQAEIEALALYLEGGGKLLAMVDPFSAPRLVALLERYGVRLGEDIVLDPENRLGGGELWSAVISDLNRQHLVTSTLDSPVLFSGTRSVEARNDESARRTATRLLRSGERSWASEDPTILRGSAPRFVAGRDRNGPFTVGVEVTQRVGIDAATARLIVYGDSQFVTNRFLEYLGNRDLLLNSLNWLARDDALVSARAKEKTPGKNFFFVSQAEMSQMFKVAVMIQPGLFIVLGVVVFVYRRFRP